MVAEQGHDCQHDRKDPEDRVARIGLIPGPNRQTLIEAHFPVRTGNPRSGQKNGQAEHQQRNAPQPIAQLGVGLTGQQDHDGGHQHEQHDQPTVVVTEQLDRAPLPAKMRFSQPVGAHQLQHEIHEQQHRPAGGQRDT